MADRPRVLVFTPTDAPPPATDDHNAPAWDLVTVGSLEEGLARLQSESFDGLYWPAQTNGWVRLQVLLQNETILGALAEGVAVIQPDWRIKWANATFERWCGQPVLNRIYYEALGYPAVIGNDGSPLQTALRGVCVNTRFHRKDNQYLDVRITPIFDANRKVVQLISLCRDVTAEVQQRQKLDALHQAAVKLSYLETKDLTEMSLDERVEQLKYNIRQLTHDLLHYDVIEIRLLEPLTGLLRPLLSDGMTPEAAGRTLHAKVTGNGVTGHVAATGKTHVCSDTANDPHYIQGAEDARSSLTVALNYGDHVIGTFNVESPQLNGFGPDDVQFTEIFCRELAAALHTLDLLLVEKQTTATRSVEAINCEVSIPIDEILGAATSLYERWIGHEEEMAEILKTIIDKARGVKECIQRVGADIAPDVKPLAFSPRETPVKLNLRILVVDNDERVRRSAHSILARHGCVVETARDGREAVSIARLSHHDVILADINLPDMGGYDVYRALRLARPSAHVILMTGFGYDPSHSLVKARQDGLRFVLFKPFRVDQLLSALQETAQPRIGSATPEAQG